MGHDDRFRGQDPDNEYGYDESSMQQDQGGRPHTQDDGYLYGQDEFPSGLSRAKQGRHGTHARDVDELGGYEGEPPDEDTDGTW
ncbi:hypothetical protein [Actinomadura sp. 9N215]|uniref:hypothetical protein n=1 Tax=Actinomadura sp. 9N215 TaxID=3375150 RepID=UPI0037B1EA0A